MECKRNFTITCTQELQQRCIAYRGPYIADEFLVIAFGYHLLHLGLRKPHTLMKCNKVTPTYTLHRYQE